MVHCSTFQNSAMCKAKLRRRKPSALQNSARAEQNSAVKCRLHVLEGARRGLFFWPGLPTESRWGGPFAGTVPALIKSAGARAAPASTCTKKSASSATAGRHGQCFGLRTAQLQRARKTGTQQHETEDMSQQKQPSAHRHHHVLADGMTSGAKERHKPHRQTGTRAANK